MAGAANASGSGSLLRPQLFPRADKALTSQLIQCSSEAVKNADKKGFDRMMNHMRFGLAKRRNPMPREPLPAKYLIMLALSCAF